jgi:hypothetical protein
MNFELKGIHLPSIATAINSPSPSPSPSTINLHQQPTTSSTAPTDAPIATTSSQSTKSPTASAPIQNNQ